MKNFLSILVALLVTSLMFSQQIYFSFANAQNTNDGSNDYYEVDVMISTDVDFKLGSGQLYFNYNTEAFGENVSASSKIDYTQPVGYILGEVYGFPAYKDFIQNDNTISRVSLSYQQGVSSGTISANNVTLTPKKLFHIKIQYLDNSKPPLVEFETLPIFLDQTFTACGPSSFGFPDCTNSPGIQLVDDNFDSSGAVLGLGDIELLVGITLFPNPTSDAIFIEGLAEKTNIKIYNTIGAMVFESKDYLNGEISLKNISPGVYFVKMINQTGGLVKKIIKN